MVESVDELIRRKNAEWERARERQKPFKTKDVGREGRHLWCREAWTWLPQHNYGEKVFVIERLRNVGQEGRRAFDGGARPGDIEYRFGYWIVGRIGRAKGKWWWAQFSPLIPHRDLEPLLEKARAEGTFIDPGDAPMRHGSS